MNTYINAWGKEKLKTVDVQTCLKAFDKKLRSFVVKNILI